MKHMICSKQDGWPYQVGLAVLEQCGYLCLFYYPEGACLIGVILSCDPGGINSILWRDLLCYWL